MVRAAGLERAQHLPAEAANQRNPSGRPIFRQGKTGSRGWLYLTGVSSQAAFLNRRFVLSARDSPCSSRHLAARR
jgi:hypothetical protein